ncbi:MAG: ribosome assembly factor SBDS [Candidatus Hadarchaeales archaeon]
MVRLEEAVIARAEVQGASFEILVDPELALALKQGKQVNIREMLAVERIFKDARKGEEVPRKSLEEVFQTTDVLKVAEEIVKRGQVQLTTEMRRRMREEKLRQIVSLISKRAVNPQTGTPHPPSRIEAALEQAKVKIDEFKSAEEQLPAILRSLSSVLPISVEMRRIEIKVPAQHAAKAYGALKAYKPCREEWLQDGSLRVEIEIPAALQAEFFEKVNQLTKGEAQVRVCQ